VVRGALVELEDKIDIDVVVGNEQIHILRREVEALGEVANQTLSAVVILLTD